MMKMPSGKIDHTDGGYRVQVTDDGICSVWRLDGNGGIKEETRIDFIPAEMIACIRAATKADEMLQEAFYD